MVGSQDTDAIFEGLLVQGDGFVEPARILIGAGKIVARGQGAGMAKSQDIARLSDGISESKGQLWHSQVGCIV